MTDPLRISSNNGKIPDLSTKKDHSKVIQQIRLMEPSTAFLAVQTTLVPVLHGLDKNSSTISSSLARSPKIDSSSIVDITKSLDRIKDSFTDIQTRLKELEKNAQEILDLMVENKGAKTKITDKDLWIYPDDDKFLNDPESHGGIFGRFYSLRGVIEKRLDSIKKEIDFLEKNFSNNPLIKKLKDAVNNLLDNMPKASDKWNSEKWTYDGKIWQLKWGAADRVLWTVAWEERGNKSPNSTGFLDLVQDKKKFGEYLSNATNGINQVTQFYKSHGIHLLKMQFLDTESAYMYLITVLLPFLQDESAEALERQGETMKTVSKIHDKWNELQDIINSATRAGNKDTSAQLKNKIQKITIEINNLLDKAKGSLPQGADSLIATMKELSGQLIANYLTDFFEMAKDSDQTKFKSYIDILAQGITALTSISNMTQQELQIATQNHNSLLGLQKNALDSLNKVIQLATKSPNY